MNSNQRRKERRKNDRSMSNFKMSNYANGPVYYKVLGTYISDQNNNMICDIRGWGRIKHMNVSDPERFQDTLGEWIAEAINEKMQREEDQLNNQKTKPTK